MLNRWLALGLVVVLACVLVIGCAPARPSAPETPLVPEAEEEEETLLLGNLSPLSGPLLVWGVVEQEACYWWRDEVNARGGLKVGGKTYKIKVISYDDKGETAAGMTAFNKMVYEDGVRHIFSMHCGFDPEAILATVDQEEILMLITGSFESPMGPGHHTWFKVIPTPWIRYPVLIEWIATDHPEVRSMMEIAPDTEGGRHVEKSAERAISAAGIEYLGTEFYEAGTVDFTPLLTRVMIKDPDGIDMGLVAPADQAQMCKTLREMGYTGMMGTVSSGMDAEVFCGIAGVENAEGFWAVALSGRGGGAKYITPEYKIYQGAWIEKYKTWNDWAAEAYMALQIMEQAIQRANSVDPVLIADQIEGGKDFEILTGTAYFGGIPRYGRAGQIMTPVPIGQIRSGHFETVYVGIPEDVP